MGFQKANALHKGHALAEFLLRFTGEAYDHVGGEAHPVLPEGGPQAGDRVGVLLGGVGAAHSAQGGGAAALQREMELRAQGVHVGQPGHILIRKQIRFQAAQADAADARHRGGLLDQAH